MALADQFDTAQSGHPGQAKVDQDEIGAAGRLKFGQAFLARACFANDKVGGEWPQQQRNPFAEQRVVVDQQDVHRRLQVRCHLSDGAPSEGRHETEPHGRGQRPLHTPDTQCCNRYQLLAEAINSLRKHAMHSATLRPESIAGSHNRGEVSSWAPLAAGLPSSVPVHLLWRVVDELDYGLMLATPDGHVRFANRIALQECRTARCIRLADGIVKAPDARANGEVRKALFGAAAGRRCMLTLNCGGSVLVIALVPLGEELDTSSALGTVLLVFGRRQVCEPLSVEFFARERGITLAETAVLRGLCQGQSPADVARQAGVAVSTVRSQICSLRIKTGARSIGELIRMITVLPPIVPVLN